MLIHPSRLRCSVGAEYQQSPVNRHKRAAGTTERQHIFVEFVERGIELFGEEAEADLVALKDKLL